MDALNVVNTSSLVTIVARLLVAEQAKWCNEAQHICDHGCRPDSTAFLSFVKCRANALNDPVFGLISGWLTFATKIRQASHSTLNTKQQLSTTAAGVSWQQDINCVQCGGLNHLKTYSKFKFSSP